MLTGNNLRFIRVAAKMDQCELAAAAGVSTQLVSLIETGHRKLTANVARKFRQAIGFDDNTLMDLVGVHNAVTRDR